jgi:hypothetical protein
MSVLEVVSETHMSAATMIPGGKENAVWVSIGGSGGSYILGYRAAGAR